MAGAGKKTFQVNEVLSAADVNQYLMDQSVMRFADDTARSSAIPTPDEGMVSYLDDTNQVEVYDGASWVNFTGDITQVTAGTALTGGGTEGNVTLDVDLSAVTIPTSQISDITATAAELNVLDGITATTTELNYTDGVTSDIQTQLDDKEPLQRTIGVEITSRTLEIADAKKTLIAVNAVTLTVPDSVFSAGHRIDFIQDASDPITFAAGAGVTINSKDGALSTSAQYAGASIVFADASTAYLIGDLA